MSYPVPPKHFANEELHRQLISDCVGGIMKGHTNNTGSVTLASSVASTTISDIRLSNASVILLMPTTANAAAALATTYVSSRTEGSAVLTHTNNAQIDRSFNYIIVG